MTHKMVKTILAGALPALFSVVTVSNAPAADVYLRAEAITKPMPDPAGGPDIPIPMWGFAQDDAFQGLELAPASVPGPRLVVPPGDTTLNIHLDNNLTVPISIVIPGQVQALTPTKFTDATGRLRARAFTHETPAGNTAAVTYSWTGLRPGTYLYHSGSHPQIQVQMGLYGAMTHDAALGQAYTGVAYDAETLLIYSAIDPAIHAAVAGGTYVPFGDPATQMTSTMGYEPKYFLVNGEPYRPGVTADIAAGNVGNTILLRVLNASQESKAPLLLGLYMNVVAENGSLYPFPKERYVLFLPAGNTRDALMTPTTGQDGRYPIFDRKLNLTNAGAPTPGGMLSYLVVAP